MTGMARDDRMTRDERDYQGYLSMTRMAMDYQECLG